MNSIEKRVIAFFSIFTLIASVLYLRIGILGSFSGLEETAQNQSEYTLVLEERRGMIYDLNLNPLVNRQKEKIYAVLPSSDNMNKVLNSVSDTRKEGIYKLLKSAKPFILKTDKNIDADNVVEFYRQNRYEYYQLAPHIIGYLDSEGNGITGIEKSYDSFLKEHITKVKASYFLDGMGHAMAGVEGNMLKEEKDNAGVVLSIDKDIQAVIQNIGGRDLKKGAIVVMNPYNGELKGVASFPSYTPVDLQKSILDVENSPMINRAFLPFNVGSTFKIVTAAAALENDIDITKSVECKGTADVKGQTIRCHKREGHGVLDMVDGMKESCNPYFINLGLSVGNEILLDYAEKFGFGRGYTLAEGIYTSKGTLPTENDLLNPAEIANLSFGQGKLTATPVQVAQMMSAVVNGGYLVAPKLVSGETKDGEKIEKFSNVPKEKIISTETALQLQNILTYCVMVADGQNAMPQNITAGGKTATAQTGKYIDGKEIEHGWFAGFFPADNPEYVVVVLSEGAGYGNNTAAPIFSKIADSLAQ